MYSLSEQQIDFILNDIRARGIETESLQQNLLDHICCTIEQNLEADGDFGEFYQSVIKTFYKKELREIEAETTILLTFKNYYTMKKIMIVSGIFTVITFIAGSFFKIMHWPGASVLLFLGLTGVSLLFLPLLFILKLKESKSSRDKWIIGLGSLSGSLYFLCMLLRVQHWNGVHILWYSTLIISFFIFLPIYFFTGIRRPETRVNTIVSSIIILAIIGSQFTITALYKPQQQQVVTGQHKQIEK